MALSRLSFAPENASGYALPITQLTKSPPGPEAKVDSVLFISLGFLAANSVHKLMPRRPQERETVIALASYLNNSQAVSLGFCGGAC
jgi:hypothetical protein